MNLQAKLLERFMRYVAITSQSNAAVKTVPTTSGQREMAELLKTELAELGLVDLEISEFSVLTGKLPANLPAGHHAVPAVGWVAHLDTVDVCLNADIHPHVVANYQGGDICLNEEKQIFLKVSEHPEIEKYIGQDIVVSDGTSVLGADDKAAIANVMVALETLANDKTIYHGDIYVCFVPDEEIGLLGAKAIDFEKFPVDFAYTIDCCEQGEVVYETFNAGSAEVYIKGVTAHPMSAKGVLVNPTLVATDLVNSFDRMQTPEHTEGTEGYIWVTAINSNVSEARVNMAIRDHNKVLFEARKEQIKNAVEYVIMSDFLLLHLQTAVRCPHYERNLHLLARRHRHRHAVHIQVVLSERLTMVGDKKHATVPAIQFFHSLYCAVNQIVCIYYTIVICVVQLCRIYF